MLRELRAEIGMAPDTNLQAGVVDTHKALLQRNQRLLYLEEDWPGLFTSFNVEVPALATSVTLHAEMDPSGVQEVYVSDTAASARACRVQNGWDESEITAADPTTPSWPIMFWRFEPLVHTDKAFDRAITFWPRPDRACTMTFRGRRALAPLVDETDRSTLDSDLIVLQTAAEILNEQNSPNGTVKAAAAQQRKRTLLAMQRGEVSENFSMLPGTHTRYRG
jgi:hypothetical protein